MPSHHSKNPYPQSPPMTEIEIDSFLDNAEIATICTHNQDGTIHAVPVWYLYSKNEIHFGSQTISKKIQNIMENNQVTVLVDVHEMPYKGVMIYGIAMLEFDDVISKRIEIFKKYVSQERADRMVRSYAHKFDQVYVRIKINSITSWDYSK